MAREIPISQIPKDADPYEVGDFTNFTDETFVGIHNGDKYPVPPKTSIKMSKTRAALFAKQLANKVIFENLEEDILKTMSDKELEKLDGMWQRHNKAISQERIKGYIDLCLASPEKTEELKAVADGVVYTCPECSKEFDKAQGLRLHIMKSHKTLYEELYSKEK